jgi:bacteriocin-like protein
MPKMSKDQPHRAKPETLVKAGKKAQIELTESDLKKVSGGLKVHTHK